MLNYLISILMLLIVVSGFDYSYKITGIERTFISLSPSVIEMGIANLEDSNNEVYFDKVLLNKLVKEYLTANLTPYTKSYLISFYYFDLESMNICMNYCQGVQITLAVDLSPFPKYMKSYNYMIKRSEYYG